MAAEENIYARIPAGLKTTAAAAEFVERSRSKRFPPKPSVSARAVCSMVSAFSSPVRKSIQSSFLSMTRHRRAAGLTRYY